MTTMDTGNVVVAEEKEEEEEDPYPYDIYISARINDKLEYRWYVIKNDTKENEFLSPVFSDLQPNCKFASSSACVVALGSFLYVLGGFDLTDKNHDEDGNLIIFNPLKDPPHTDDDLYTNEVYRIDTLHLEDGWTKCPPMAKKRSCALGFSLDGKIYVLGGFTLPVIHKRPDCWPDWFLRGDDDDSSKSIDVPSSQSQSTSEHNNYIEFLDPEEGEAKWRPALSSIPDDYLREHHIDAFLIREKPSGGGARELFVRIVGNETQKLFRYDFNDESWTLYANDFGPYRCQSLVFADDILYSYDNYPAWEGKLTKASKVAPGSILCFDVNKPEAEPNELKGLEDLLPKPKYFNMFPMVTLHHLGGTKFCLIWEENYTILEPNEGDEIVVTCLKFTVSKVPLEKQGEFDFCATQLSKSSSCLEAKDFVNIISIENAPQIRWRKGELIGCGAFGRVYMGMNLDSGELLAVRQVLIATNSASKEKAQAHIKELEEEVKYLKNLSHPNIVRYLGTVREEEYLNILLEFVPGGSISSLLGKFGSFPEAVIRTYTKQLLLGLEYLHKNGIMHRDIKGANILVDNKGCIKLADFGAFKKVVELATVSGAKSMKGTPYWMAPEVILQTGHSFSADIWSVGCTVIEMATGKPPWSEQYQEVAALFHIGTTKSHPPIPEHLSVEAKDFLLRCLQKEPEVRQPANELLKHPFVSGEVNISSVLIPDDFNKSFNPMCEPADDWRHNYDGSAEPGTRGTSMDTDQPVKRSVQFWRGPVKRSASSPEISGVGGKDFSFHCGRSLSEEDDELTESRITAFLDEQILYLKKLQTRLYEEYEVYDSSLNAASSPNFAETRSEIRKCKEELEHLEISKWKEKLEHSKVPKWKE